MPKFVFPSTYDGSTVVMRSMIEGGPLVTMWSKPAAANGVRRMEQFEGEDALDVLIELNELMGGERTADGHEAADRLGLPAQKTKKGKGKGR